jgi:hypothetical protein
VILGAYISVIFSLGLELDLVDPQRVKLGSSLAAKGLSKMIRLNDYSQLKRLAWQLKRTMEISPEEALAIYERNWRHIRGENPTGAGGLHGGAPGVRLAKNAR